jgi:hypothetical protein
MRRSDQIELCTHFDPSLEAAGHGAKAGVEAVDPFDFLTAIRRNCESVVHRDSLDHEHVVLGLDFADGLDLELFALDFDLTRLQRAGKGAGQSAACRSDDVVEGRRVWGELLRRDAVVLSDLGVDPEYDGVLLSGKVRESLGAAEPLDPHLRHVAHVTHGRNATPVSGSDRLAPCPAAVSPVMTLACSSAAFAIPRSR